MLSQCFVVAGVLAVSFVFYERYLGDRAMVPVCLKLFRLTRSRHWRRTTDHRTPQMKLFKSRSIYAIVLLAFFVRVLLMIITYVSHLLLSRSKSVLTHAVALPVHPAVRLRHNL